MMESQSCDAEPPPPPKPELRYPGISRGTVEGEHSWASLAPPAGGRTSCLTTLSLYAHRVQPAQQGPAHPHHVQVPTHLQPRQEPHGAHARIRQPGSACTHTHTHAGWLCCSSFISVVFRFVCWFSDFLSAILLCVFSGFLLIRISK